MQALGYQQVKLKAMYNLMEASKQCREVSLKIHKILNLKIIINLIQPITNKIRWHKIFKIALVMVGIQMLKSNIKTCKKTN